MNKLVVPDTGLELSVGDLVMLERFPGTKWSVQYGWYMYNTYQSMGWYFCSIPAKMIVPASGSDLSGVTIISSQSGTGYNPSNPYNPQVPPAPSSPPQQGNQVHGQKPAPVPPELIMELDRAFVTVDTIAQRDIMSATKMLPHGKLVKVNYTPYNTEKYYSWNQVCQQWDEVDFSPDLEGYLTEEQAQEIFATKESIGDKYLSKDDARETYLSKEGAKETYLSSEKAEGRYLSKEDAAKIYLDKETAEETYVSSDDLEWEPI